MLMNGTLPELIVLAIGGSIAPPLLFLTVLFLGSWRPIPNASALVLGYVVTCGMIGISGLVLFGGAENTISTVGRIISVSVGTLLVVFGIRSLVIAPDPDASPRGWMESAKSMSPPRAFAFGMALFPLQIKNLAIFVACLNLIIASSLSLQGSIVELVLVLMVFAIPVLVLIGIYAAAPQREERHPRVIAHVDGEKLPQHNGRNLPRVRNVLAPQWSSWCVGAWATMGTLQRRSLRRQVRSSETSKWRSC
jgi:hypothetical protein